MQSLIRLIERLKELEEEKKKLSLKIRKMHDFINKDKEIFEDKLIHEIEDIEDKNYTIAGVDGSVIKKELHGADIVVTRACSVFFQFENGKLIRNFQIPKNRNPEIIVLNSLDSKEFQITSSLLQVEKEIDIALKSLDYNPDMLILDGSLIPSYLEKPQGDLGKTYESIREKYRNLYRECRERGILLTGIIEDSRGKRFIDIISRKIPLSVKEKSVLSKITDTSLLHYILNDGERTCTFSYYPEEFKGNKEIMTFYMRNVREDIPVRVEFLKTDNFERDLEKLSSIIYSTLRFNKRYGIPNVLVEADQRARLSSLDGDLIVRSIKAKIGINSSFRELRRDRRPF